jgi:hypothetical protein
MPWSSLGFFGGGNLGYSVAHVAASSSRLVERLWPETMLDGKPFRDDVMQEGLTLAI